MGQTLCGLNIHKIDDSLKKAVLFAVGNTLVCDDLEEAKVLSWSGERFKGKFLLLFSFISSSYNSVEFNINI